MPIQGSYGNGQVIESACKCAAFISLPNGLYSPLGGNSNSQALQGIQGLRAGSVEHRPAFFNSS